VRHPRSSDSHAALGFEGWGRAAIFLIKGSAIFKILCFLFRNSWHLNLTFVAFLCINDFLNTTRLQSATE
jgi:hypothetical protein